jgi:hypothetical protein
MAGSPPLGRAEQLGTGPRVGVAPDGGGVAGERQGPDQARDHDGLLHTLAHVRVPDLGQGGADRGVHLHHRAVQLWLDPFTQLGTGRGQNPPGHRAQLAAGRVDELELLLDPEAERLAQVAMPRMRSTNWR